MGRGVHARSVETATARQGPTCTGWVQIGTMYRISGAVYSKLMNLETWKPAMTTNENPYARTLTPLSRASQGTTSLFPCPRLASTDTTRIFCANDPPLVPAKAARDANTLTTTFISLCTILHTEASPPLRAHHNDTFRGCS